jgi:hypothetical protein
MKTTRWSLSSNGADNLSPDPRRPFVSIVIWMFVRKRKVRFEKDAKIPFDDRKD